MIFRFVIRYLGFLKFIPGVALLFDHFLRVITVFTQPAILDWMDAIEKEIGKLPHVKVTTHKYGGTQFNCNGKEIGHIHGNGLLDMLLNRKIKQQLMAEGRIQDHHSFKNTGWISFFMRKESDRDYAIYLLKLGYERIRTADL